MEKLASFTGGGFFSVVSPPRNLSQTDSLFIQIPSILNKTNPLILILLNVEFDYFQIHLKFPYTFLSTFWLRNG